MEKPTQSFENFDFRKEEEQHKFENLPEARQQILIERAHEEALQIDKMLREGKIVREDWADPVEQAVALVKKERIKNILESNPDFKTAISGYLKKPKFPYKDKEERDGPMYKGSRGLEDLSEDETKKFIAFLITEHRWSEGGKGGVEWRKRYGVFRKDIQDMLVTDYETVRDRFNPEHDNPRQWWTEIKFASVEEVEKYRKIWEKRKKPKVFHAGYLGAHRMTSKHQLVASKTKTDKIPAVDILLFSGLDSAHDQFKWEQDIPEAPSQADEIADR